MTKHNQLNIVTLILADGSTYKIKSSLKKHILKLDIDTTSHSLWTNKSNYDFIYENSQIAKFKKRFG
jgi:large subunit ribosomal protein L31